MSKLIVSSFSFFTLFSVMFSSAASANPNDSEYAQTPSFESYFYAGAKVGQMHYQNACEDWSISCEANDTGYGVFAGYQFWQHLGFETAYLDLGEAVADYSESGVDNRYVGTMKGWELSAITRMNLSENFELFAKAGSLYWDGDNQGPLNTTSDSDWAPMVGIGLEYAMTPSWIARVEYQYIDSLGSELIGGSNGHLTTLGISYRFGSSHSKTKPAPQPMTEPAIVEPIVPAVITLPALAVTTLFEFDSSEVSEVAPLMSVLERLLQQPTTIANIKGYTDSKGNVEYNQALSERRAQAVADYFISQGVKPQQVEVHGYGEQSPILDNNSENHRHENRRVLIYIPPMTLPAK